MKNKVLLFVFLFASAYAFGQISSAITVIPQPVRGFVKEGKFELKADTRIYYPQGQADWEMVAQYFMAVAQASTGFQLVAQPYKAPIGQPRVNGIYFIPDNNVEYREGYQLEVMPNSHVAIRAQTAAGAFYGMQSLRQLFPPRFNSSQVVKDSTWTAPGCVVTDNPRFGYRGMHLDVARHFFPVEFVKRYIDLLAMHKFNRFHWHLTDDQGWRIEIKKYPKLQTVASCRKETVVGHANDAPAKYDGKQHCGYYTQAEIKEVVEYARKRFITIVPEIEMPGHAMAALAAYPELGCTGGPYDVATTWGIFNDVFCAGNDKTFEFITGVLDEVCALFPGEYIHVGGDECPKDRWKACSKCQNRMKTEGIKDEHELQSYFIRRAGQVLAKHKKKLIGWDEILEGGLAPSATVMSWRGTEGGIAAVREGHNAIMSPGSHCYFDHYQSDPANEPLAISGFTTVQRVYEYEPIPATLSEEEGRLILGAQGNVWTEYMDNQSHLDYMVFPRAFALSEVLWTPASKKTWGDFARRLKHHFKVLEVLGVNYAKSIYDVKSNFSGGYVTLTTGDRTTQIKYTRDGSEPKNTSSGFYSPIGLQQSSTIKAAAFLDGKQVSKTLTVRYLVHKALGKPYTLTKQPDQYSGGERHGLTNGITGALRSWNNWIGVTGSDLDPVIDFGATTEFNKVTTNFLNAKSSWIYPPRSIEIFVSEDGQNFTSLGKKNIDTEGLKGDTVEAVVFSTPGAKGRYLKLVAQTFGAIPGDASGAGNNAWLFLDEIVVE
ncbi:MAG: family 20 glycosylhydrolase [Saprospiraceae bacterium]|jgi:hexosaminidase|nr:family 20 glycosylhydrolase [Saprospiraceae bacterium]